MEKRKDQQHKKVIFRLKRDSDGYPPDEWESLWAVETPVGLSIDNIPFFVRGISPGDIVSVREKRKELHFDRVEEFSDHSVLRVLVLDTDKTDELTSRMNELGCEWEGSHIEGLIAFDVPPDANFDEVSSFLQSGEDNDLWEYEEASLRH